MFAVHATCAMRAVLTPCLQVVRGNSIVMMEALEKLWSEVPKPSDFGGR